VVLVWIGLLAVITKWPVNSSCHLSLKIGNWLMGHLLWISLAEMIDASLIKNGPVSELGDSWYKNWISAAVSLCSTGLLQCLRTHSIHMPMR